MQRVSIILLLGLLMLLAACGGGGDEEHETIDENDTEPTTQAIELTAEAMLDDEEDSGDAGTVEESSGDMAETDDDAEEMEGSDDGDSEGVATGDAAAGEELFAQTVVGSAPGCASCHSLEEGVRLAGPSMAGISERAGTMEEGLSAEEYITQSIVAPNAIVVEGYSPNIMYQQYGEDLSEQQISDLVAYLLTQ